MTSASAMGLQHKPAVSIIIPAYNAGKYIFDAVNSALHQSIRDVEVIVIDDGSTDNTKDVLRPFWDDIVYRYKINSGVSAARNDALNMARGEWIAFLDSDDYWTENHLERLMQRAEEDREVCLVYGGSRWVDANSFPLADVPEQKTYPEGWIFRDLLQANYISCPSSVLVKRSTVLASNGFDTALRYSEDYDLWLRISAQSKVASLPTLLFFRRMHDKNATLNSLELILSSLKVLNKAVPLITAGTVHPKNHMEMIDVSKLMRIKYYEAGIRLFFLRKYDVMRAVDNEAARRGYRSLRLFLLSLIALLPPSTIETIRRIGKVVISKLMRKDD